MTEVVTVEMAMAIKRAFGNPAMFKSALDSQLDRSIMTE